MKPMAKVKPEGRIVYAIHRNELVGTVIEFQIDGWLKPEYFDQHPVPSPPPVVLGKPVLVVGEGPMWIVSGIMTALTPYVMWSAWCPADMVVSAGPRGLPALVRQLQEARVAAAGVPPA